MNCIVRAFYSNCSWDKASPLLMDSAGFCIAIEAQWKAGACWGTIHVRMWHIQNTSCFLSGRTTCPLHAQHSATSMYRAFSSTGLDSVIVRYQSYVWHALCLCSQRNENWPTYLSWRRVWKVAHTVVEEVLHFFMEVKVVIQHLKNTQIQINFLHSNFCSAINCCYQ